MIQQRTAQDREYNRDYANARRLRLKAEGRCQTCETPTTGSRCRPCQDYHNRQRSRRRREKMASPTAGICTNCFKTKTQQGHKTCTECRRNRRRLTAAWKRQGLCSKCGELRDQPHLLCCARCRANKKKETTVDT